jgi:hypothetical protein
VSALPPPDTVDLAEFPRVDIYEPLFRVHRRDRGMVRFSTAGTWRFDPPPGDDDYGVCYAAAEPLGAVVETLGRVLPLRPEEVARRNLAVLAPSRELRLADLTNRYVLGEFGLTADISVASDYTISQLWSVALRRAGFDGIRYIARHDPACRSTSYALFSPRSGHIHDILDDKSESHPLDVDEVVADLDAFGVRFMLERPGGDHYLDGALGGQLDVDTPVHGDVVYLHDSIDDFPDPFLQLPPRR